MFAEHSDKHVLTLTDGLADGLASYKTRLQIRTYLMFNGQLMVSANQRSLKRPLWDIALSDG